MRDSALPSAQEDNIIISSCQTQTQQSEGAGKQASSQKSADTQSQSQTETQSPQAFSFQLDMAQAAPMARPGPFHMNHMANSLPQAPPPTYEQQNPYQSSQPGRYSNHSSPPMMPQMTQHMSQYGSAQSGMPLHGHGYYIQAQHPQMHQYFGQQLSPSQHQHQQNQQQRNMSATPNMAYYHSPMAANSQPAYYYPHAPQYQGQGQGVPQHVMPGSYGSVSPDAALASHSPGTESGGVTQSSGSPDKQSIVRGPPRKPRQSGHAIWIGNLPPQTDLMSLVHHVCKEAPGLESLFLISKSNCAFANFKDEQTCAAAQQKLHDSKFQTVRLVSRLRKSTVEGAAGVTAPTGPSATQTAQIPDPGLSPQPDVESAKTTSPAPDQQAKSKRSTSGERSPRGEKYFILKSLTVEDLELSVRTGIWATQSHNEESLNDAFKDADHVYLVFSANKSGEYFGYARMISPINDDPAAAIEFAPKAQSTNNLDLPKAIPTEPTEYAPKGRIIDDLARGTIFWEADTEEAVDSASEAESEVSSGKSEQEVDDGSAKTWGKPFKLEWLSTTRLPFYRTRGLRNPWNSNREVKIARDGTELEPSVGRRLIALFNGAPSAGPVPGAFRPGMPPMMGHSGYPQIRPYQQ